MNQYPHQEEMYDIIAELKDIIKNGYASTPLVAVHTLMNRNYHLTKDTAESLDSLSDLEEAVVLKLFGEWYQRNYKNHFSNGRKRL